MCVVCMPDSVSRLRRAHESHAASAYSTMLSLSLAFILFWHFASQSVSDALLHENRIPWSPPSIILSRQRITHNRTALRTARINGGGAGSRTPVFPPLLLPVNNQYFIYNTSYLYVNKIFALFLTQSSNGKKAPEAPVQSRKASS